MIKKIKYKGKEIVLVGTAHISKESITLVEETIEKEKPDVIGVELDKDRLGQLLSGKKWQETNIIDVIKSGKTYLFLLNTLLSNMQKQLGKHVGVKPGADMLAAVKKAQEKNIPIHLLDRNVRVTLKRAFKAMSIWEKMKLGGSILGSFFGVGEKIDAKKIEELKNEDLINKLMKELGKQMPSVKKVLVDERDDFISEMIKRSPGKKVLAVVGAGHLTGIVANIKKDKKVNLKKISIVPKKKPYLKYLKWTIPIIFILFLGYLLYFKGVEATLAAFGIWFLANGTLSAVGAALARAHPITILTAFVAAPFTSLHPAIAAGWFAAIVETKFNPPLVKDFEDLSNVGTISGFYRNKVTHLLLVTAFANIGSMIGTVVALPFLIQLLL
jgi:pheromone shutdown-related protein TraB